MTDRAGTSVFLSYSRSDLVIANQLIYSLEAFGFAVLVDHEGIRVGENWRERLRQLILQADSVIFALSPASAASGEVHWEVDTALALSKRIVPAVVAPLGDVRPHPALADLNYVFFYPEPTVPDAGFGKGLSLLVDALTQDLAWIRDHTRLIELAERWNRGRPSDLLIRGTELEAFSAWRRRRPGNAPELTQLQIEFLNASDQKERRDADMRRRELDKLQDALMAESTAQAERALATKRLVRRTFAGIAVAIVLTTAAVWQATVASRQRSVAVAALERTVFEQALQDRMLGLAANRKPPENLDVDTLARRYEGQRSENVSSDFRFGHFYGVYRIRAGSDTSNMKEFLAFVRKARQHRIADALDAAGGLDAANVATPDFVETWKRLAREEATRDVFERLQRSFVLNVDFGRIKSQLNNAPDADNPGSGMTTADRSIALQAVIFAIVVQYGPVMGADLVKTALADIEVPDSLPDRDLINLLYKERDRVERYFPDIVKVSSRYGDLIRLRNQWEKSDALHMLELEEGDRSGQ